MDNFDAHKWFKKQYLAEDSLNDKAKRYFIQKVSRGEIDTLPENPKQAYLAQMMKDQSLKEDDLNEGRRRVVDYDNRDDRTTELFLDNGDSVEVDVIELYDNLKENNPEDLDENNILKENMSRGEAVVELNYYMDKLQEISNEVSGIMQEYFPTEFNQGDAYGAFDFGSSRNPRDTTFEAILDDLASMGDEME